MDEKHGALSGLPDQARSDSRSPPPVYRPALPPRSPGRLSPAFISDHEIKPSQPSELGWLSQDHRNASTDSIAPAHSRGKKRILLLIYIHGFLGDETSFQSFPAHVHNVVTDLAQETHVVHTKLYPRYKSRKHIQVARDNFSQWLSPHESPETDVILCGHSMGGLLSADIVLLPPGSPDPQAPLRHRILGTINFDVPFLGMHPGVVYSGIASLFRPTPKSPNATADQSLTSNSTTEIDANTEQSLSRSSLSLPLKNDPNFNPPFPNDVNVPVRKGWESTLHFIQKHSDGLTRATKSYVTSHLEFGGAMADYNGLRNRYRAIRALEDHTGDSAAETRAIRRVRFVNYYTASTGIRAVSPWRAGRRSPSPGRGRRSGSARSTSRSPANSPRISIDAPRKDLLSRDPLEYHQSAEGSQKRTPSSTGSLASLEPIPDETEPDSDELEPIAEASNPSHTAEPSHAIESGELHPTSHSRLSPNLEPEDNSNPAEGVVHGGAAHLEQQNAGVSLSSENPDAYNVNIVGLPPLPEVPEPPPQFDPSMYAEKDTLKLAQREHERQMKAYNRSIKDREQAVKDRKKMLDKRDREEKKRQQKEEAEAAKKLKQERKEQDRLKKATAKESKQAEKQVAEDANVPPSTGESLAATSTAALESVDSSTVAEPTRRAPAPSPLELNAEPQTEQERTRRDRKFCLLPSKDTQTGKLDATWLRVYMRGVDEVGAHCGLFDMQRDHYEGLVWEVSTLIKSWIARDIERKGRQG